MSKFILRFDDIIPGMDWNKFLKIKEVAVKYGVKSILGVVPDNKDANLSININMSNSVFFSTLKEFAEYGDTIAQHGTHHTYTIKAGGMLGINE
ncbi:hypothetical protein A1019T_02459 [Psychrobacter pasteurii]|uniref:NodB homology domain-containing protein n=1 Tax=Psychrobacter pasteurii TaxID=1945520 RepID=A0A1R4EJ16_9GAMM|nr:DUF2334 domain-containing protein [Psychrobacter pasteurii]SJM38466.1 hypothetical protein A1019T_02459 [Psychrobacter pasteurii]